MSKKAKIQAIKPEVITKFQQHEKDTGSPWVQVGILTTRINNLIDHLKNHRQDKDSRKGLLKLVGQRRRWVKYLEQTVEEVQVKKLKKDLGL